MIQDAVTVGLGYLVYKGIMAELAQEAITAPITRTKWTGEQAQAKRQQIAEAEGWQGMFFKKGTFPGEEFESGLLKWAGIRKGCTVSSGFSVHCPPVKYTGPAREAVPTWCYTDYLGTKSCTTTPPTITMPVDMTGVTEQEVVAAIDWTGYEDLERFFR